MSRRTHVNMFQNGTRCHKFLCKIVGCLTKFI
nr:MAG TPA: hypothetical protein [Caudoviricetes sp.]DAX70681.1 MAG TPA: hypothetical protein [Caudoviricetes sp.]